MKKQIENILIKNNFYKINKTCNRYIDKIIQYKDWPFVGCVECTKNKNYYTKEITKILLETDFKNYRGFFNLTVDEAKDTDFFAISPTFIEEMPNANDHEKEDIMRRKWFHKSFFLSKFIQNKRIILGVHYPKNKNPEYCISIPFYYKFNFDTEKDYQKFEDRIYEWIKNILKPLKEKSFIEYNDPVFKFKKDLYSYINPFSFPEKPFLGKKIEKKLEKARSEGFNDDNEEIKSNKIRTYTFDNIVTLEDYDVIIKKIKKYGGKKVDFNQLKLDDFIFCKTCDFWKEEFKYRKNFFNSLSPSEKKEEKYKELLKSKNIWFKPEKNIEKYFYKLIQPNFIMCDEFEKNEKISNIFNYKNRKYIEVYSFDKKEFGIYEELLKKIEYKHFSFPLTDKNKDTDYESKINILTQNFIILYRKNQGQIRYLFRISGFYSTFYIGKYLPLSLKYLNKISKIEEDIFLRNGIDGSLHWDEDQKNYLRMKKHNLEKILNKNKNF